MKNKKTIKIILLILGIVSGLFVGALLAVFTVAGLSFGFGWFEGMKLMVAWLLIIPIGAIAGAIMAGIIYNKRLNKILTGEIIRKKDFAGLIIIPCLIILISLLPLLTPLGSFFKKSQTINFTDSMGRLYYSSSELNKPTGNEFGKYGVQNLFDFDKNTCWAEGVKGSGAGEYIYLNMPAKSVGISIINGYAKSEKTFKANARVKKIQLSLYKLSFPKKGKVTELYAPVKVRPISLQFEQTLKDIDSPQNIYFPQLWLKKIDEKTALQIKILSVYPGEKHDDTCLSEISFLDKEPSKLFLSENEKELWAEKHGTKEFLMKSDDLVFQILDTQDDWAILIKMPANAQGRSEVQYSLFNIKLKKEVDFSKSGFNVYEIYGFVQKENKLFIETSGDIDSNQVQIDLEKIKF